MLQIIKFIFAFIILAGNSLAIGSTLCAVIDGEDAREPLLVSNGVFCLKLQPAFDNDGKVLPDEEQQIYAYFIQQNQKITRVSNWVISGEIGDAFNLDVDKDGKEDVVVVNANEINTYTGTCISSPWYSVSVFKQIKSGFEYDRRASEWLGWGADICDEKDPAEKVIYVFPYKTKEAIDKALSTSPFVSFIVNDAALSATVIRKSWLYESSTVATKTNKYLIAGDKVIVEKFMAGLCKITYTGSKNPLQMWLLCNALKLDSTNTWTQTRSATHFRGE
jgi:hypothetical protein